ncbi:hypothetical protein JCM3775_005123 [Rhodotorula graminis]
MVEAAIDDLNDPGIGGHTHPARDHAVPSAHHPPPDARTRQDSTPSLDATPQLNPSSLRARLLQTLAPAAAPDASSHHWPPSRQGSQVRASSLPNLDRDHRGGDRSPAQLDDDSIIKVQRRPTQVSVVPVGRHSAPSTSFDPFAAAGTAAPSTSAAPHNQQPTRAPLLSKALLEPKKPVGKNPSFRQCLVNTLRYSWLNVLLVLVPVAWALDLSHQSPTVVFCFSITAIVPLAALLGFATEELAMRVGDAFGGLLNATFGNAVELIIAILALVKGELNIVRSSMLGSLLSNCLLVLGGAYFAGGIKFYEQGHSVRNAQLNVNMLGIAVTAIVIPVGFHSFLISEGRQTAALTDDAVLRLSRGISFILLFIYGCYLIFQLWTHSYLYVPAPPPDPRAPINNQADGPQPPVGTRVFRMPSLPSWGSSSTSSSSIGRGDGRPASVRSRASSFAHGDQPAPFVNDGEDVHLARVVTTHSALEPVAAFSVHATDAQAQAAQREGFSSAATVHDLEKGGLAKDDHGHTHDDLEHQPKLSPWFGFGLLIVVTVLTGVTAEFLVGSIDGLTATGNVSKEFVALILLPVVGNAAEHVTAVTVATRNKLDLSLAVAVGSSIQIALFVIPVLVLLGWAIGQPMDLQFDTFETLLVFLAILVVNFAIGDGRSQWMEGIGLMMIYVIIALVVWFYPGSAI